MRKKAPQDAVRVVDAAADKLFEKCGQAFSDPVARAARLLRDVVSAADSVVEAKGYYYDQKVDNDDAKGIALMLWADRVDLLSKALERMRGGATT